MVVLVSGVGVCRSGPNDTRVGMVPDRNADISRASYMRMYMYIMVFTCVRLSVRGC